MTNTQLFTKFLENLFVDYDGAWGSAHQTSFSDTTAETYVGSGNGQNKFTVYGTLTGSYNGVEFHYTSDAEL